MKVQGTLLKNKKDFYLATPDGNYSIHSIADAHKVEKLDEGASIFGTIRDYAPAQLALLGWSDRIGSIEPGHLRVGVLKE